MKPLILLNFKLYSQTAGKKGIERAKAIATLRQKKYRIAIAPSLLTTSELARSISLPVFAQHTDAVLDGALTGHISLSELQSLNVKGTILNHSERKIDLLTLQKTILLCRKKKLITVVCGSTITEVKRIAAFHPDYIAYEPAELIGGKISVATAKPGIILKAVQAVRKISPKTNVLCGAGVQTKQDVQQALRLGAQGVLIGHAVAKANNPKRFLEKMLQD